MRINIPRVVIAVPLKDYAPELDGQHLHVWVNPSIARLNEFRNLVADMQERDLDKVQTRIEAPAEPATGLRGMVQSLKRMARSRQVQRVDERILAWYAELWSQGPADTHWTVRELQQLEEQDPAFLGWLINRSWEVRSEHIERKKKS